MTTALKVAAVILALLLGMATAHWNVTATGFSKDPQFTRGVKTP